MAQVKEGRVMKRLHIQNGDTGRRRAPYALRACDACRRRKGKCDGRQPCRYCAGRKQTCSFDSVFVPDEWPTSSEVTNADTTEGRHQPTRDSSSISSNQDTIMELLSSLQDQLNSLASRVHTPNHTKSSTSSPAFGTYNSNPEDFLSGLVADASVIEDCLTSLAQTSHTPQGFYGLPSPDQSVNAPQSQVPRDSNSRTPPKQSHLSLRGDDGMGNMVAITQNDGPFEAIQVHHRGEDSQLVRFRSLISLEEATRLLGVYQEVIGELHPIVDIVEIINRTRSCYADENSTGWEMLIGSAEAPSDEDLLILNLAFAIALHADSTPESPNTSTEALIMDSIENAVNKRLAAPSTSFKQIKIVLLKGCYEFFNDMPQVAWRMCGAAGRMLMEIGLHSGKGLDRMLDSESQRSELCTLLSSIFILDRQWSAASGLPANFHDSSFTPVKTISAEHPYLKAMLSLIRVSNKFSEPISQAVEAQRYDDEDDFEVLNFQIERWRKRAIGDYSQTHPQAWLTSLPRQPPSWTILLHLRAEIIRSFLLKPWFLPRSDTRTSKKYLQPAIELLFDTCDILYALNATTDIYRKQHPYYQDLLASASALGFVLTASLEQNKTTLLVSLTTDLADHMGRSYELAVALAASYVTRSKSARKLSDKLSEVRGNLIGLGMLSYSSPAETVNRGDVLGSSKEGFPRANTARTAQKMATMPHQNSQESQSGQGRSPFLDGCATADTGMGSPTGADLGTAYEAELEWEETFQSQWPLVSMGNMSSGGIF
ncbi:hypothetical protein EsH8_VII_000560 [Colletotrichum jinshuiense]